MAKAIRETPRNYTRPLPSRRVERALKGAIYDSYVRQIVWEGLLDEWKDELVEWATCPLPAKHSVFSMQNAQSVLRRLRGFPPETDDLLVCPYAWAAEIHPLNCEIVWPAQLNLTDYHVADGGEPTTPLLQLDEPWYSGRIKHERLVERLLATAGIRLAAILNDIFGEDDDVAALGPLIDV